ncbi:MAG TPA: L-glutamate gamma-semialdehyde dehydrogenase [Myxococcota bacterium]|jgi:1-pyrroline-5-carboxylate dehydrogenase|nr:L-glutamate gamma-semialdehyde dehydrogenase [Myxococcota bacterium]
MAAANLIPFANEAPLNGADPDVRRRFAEALSRAEARFPEALPLVVAGERVTTAHSGRSLNPCAPEQVVATFAQAGEAEVQRALAAADAAFAAWRWVSWKERAAVLLRAAEILRRRRLEIDALLCLEAGKTFAEAEAEFAEAVDFCEFYAREALRWGGPQPLTPLRGEYNELHYLPLGPGVVIPPWNFPLAILGGMTVAAVVCGNSVVLKPSSDTVRIGWAFFEALEEAGVPPGVVNFVPGPGAVAGEAAARHAATRFVSFTGSKAVGLRLVEVAAQTVPGQRAIKRVVAEMGGKDFIVVDDSADLEAASAAIVASAFGYQGQKCSACSRAIVHARVYDEVVERVAAGARALKVGPARDSDTAVAAVINEGAMRSILGYVEVGRGEGRVVAGGKRAAGAGPGYFVEPTVVADLAPRARLACEEVFGPVLAMLKADSFERAVELANDTEYGLTGSFFARDRAHIARAKRLLHCGNLYVNRKCTGALVGVHPFGGFDMSGTDSKAGGRDYLGLFTQAKLVSEKLG